MLSSNQNQSSPITLDNNNNDDREVVRDVDVVYNTAKGQHYTDEIIKRAVGKAKPNALDGSVVGGGLKFETAKFHNFQFGVSGFYIFNIGSSDFTKDDSLTGQFNRYEIGLFDVEDPANKKDLDRLEELYLKYKIEKILLYSRTLATYG